MITIQNLIDLDFSATKNNQDEWFFDSWEYLYVRSTREFFNINDGFGEPELLTIIENLDHLKEILSIINDINDAPIFRNRSI